MAGSAERHAGAWFAGLDRGEFCDRATKRRKCNSPPKHEQRSSGEALPRGLWPYSSYHWDPGKVGDKEVVDSRPCFRRNGFAASHNPASWSSRAGGQKNCSVEWSLVAFAGSAAAVICCFGDGKSMTPPPALSAGSGTRHCSACWQPDGRPPASRRCGTPRTVLCGRWPANAVAARWN